MTILWLAALHQSKLKSCQREPVTKTTMSAEKYISLQQFVLHLISVIDKSLTVVPCLHRYSPSSLLRSGFDMTKGKFNHLGPWKVRTK